MCSNCYIDPALFGFLSMIHGILMPPRQTLKLLASHVTSHSAAFHNYLGLNPTRPLLLPSCWVPVRHSDFTSSCRSPFPGACPSRGATTSPQLGGICLLGSCTDGAGGQEATCWPPQPPLPFPRSLWDVAREGNSEDLKNIFLFPLLVMIFILLIIFLWFWFWLLNFCLCLSV